MTYSQAQQDLFAYYLCGSNGYFLDLGCSNPIEINNTYLLENYGWKGLLFDIDKNFILKCQQIRKNPSYVVDLRTDDIEKILKDNNCPNLIDYISFDVDDSTLVALDNFPFSKYSFKVMTFEHDVYRVGDYIQSKSRKFFSDLGYTLACSNVRNGLPYEDWYINSEYIKNIDWLICDNTESVEIINNIKQHFNIE